MTVSVQLFATLRERAGRDTVEVELPEGATVADLLGELSELVGAMPIRVAVNREYSPEDRPLTPDDELALIPPVSGGGEVHAAVVHGPISLDRLASMVARPSAGAVVTFQGITREVERLDYEAYEEMATARIAAVLGRCHQRHDLAAIAAEHRVGAVPLGETSVIVAASSPHRPQAFAAASEAIDAIKAEAPIWKREVERGETRWVEGTTPG